MKVRVATAFCDDNEPYEEPYEALHNQVSVTGWTYDRDTRKWVPPERLSQESREKWRWDPEKQIWIDLEKEARMERYLEFRRSQGKPPTFEEWKAQRERDLQHKSE